MSLANINTTYGIDPAYIKSKDSSYQYIVQNQVNTWYSKSGISAAAKTAISPAQTDTLAKIINTDINTLVSVGFQLVSLINQYIKNPQAAKTFVMQNTIKYGNTNLQWGGKPMMYYLVQNQAMIDAAGVIQAQLAGRLSRRII